MARAFAVPEAIDGAPQVVQAIEVVAGGFVR